MRQLFMPVEVTCGQGPKLHLKVQKSVLRATNIQNVERFPWIHDDPIHSRLILPRTALPGAERSRGFSSKNFRLQSACWLNNRIFLAGARREAARWEILWHIGIVPCKIFLIRQRTGHAQQVLCWPPREKDRPPLLLHSLLAGSARLEMAIA